MNMTNEEYIKNTKDDAVMCHIVEHGGWSIDVDNEGQVVVYTGLKWDRDDLIPFEQVFIWNVMFVYDFFNIGTTVETSNREAPEYIEELAKARLEDHGAFAPGFKDTIVQLAD